MHHPEAMRDTCSVFTRVTDIEPVRKNLAGERRCGGIGVKRARMNIRTGGGRN